jgi:uncharacterized Ntn-hydrolase superfamily protein
MTFSIVAVDPATGEAGVAVASRFLAVGSVVPYAVAGAGALATQALANVGYGPDGLELLRSGVGAPAALERLVQADELRDHRQLGMVDASGRGATWTGSSCMDWAGGRTGEAMAAQGNILTGADVVDAMVEAWSASTGTLADRLLGALEAGDRAGGDRRGRQSAALLVVRAEGGYLGANDRWLDLRVDDHADPVGELRRIRALHALYWERPAADQLLPLTEQLAAELRSRLAGIDPAPAADDAFAEAAIGEPRPLPAGWDDTWQARLVTWMGVANLELRMAASGWIDPAVLEHLRASLPAGAR